MTDKLNRLSIVAQFDDIVRNRAILTAGIETGKLLLEVIFPFVIILLKMHN